MSDPPTLSSYLEAIERGMERGRYRETLALIEAALRYYPGNGQVLVWQAVVTEALGDTPAAIALADKLRHHPQVRIRADARRLLGIWQAPQLRRSEAWLTTIPDLNPLDSEPARIPASRPPSPPPPPAPPLQANSGSSYAVIWFLLGVVTVATCIGLALKVSP
jgi:tetratricopeptide (TPR) repeat protein